MRAHESVMLDIPRGNRAVLTLGVADVVKSAAVTLVVP